MIELGVLEGYESSPGNFNSVLSFFVSEPLLLKKLRELSLGVSGHLNNCSYCGFAVDVLLRLAKDKGW